MKAIDILNNEKNVIACKCNNEIKSLNTEISKNDKVEPIDSTTRDGRRVYQRGILYVMSKAFYEVYPEALLTVNFQLSNSIYCTIENMKVTDEIINNVRQRMQTIIDKNLEIKKVEMTKQEAEKFYEKEKSLRGILQLDNKYKDEVSLYFCEDYYNYFYGVMPIST